MQKLKSLAAIMCYFTIGFSSQVFGSNYLGLNFSSIDYIENNTETFDIAAASFVLGKSLNNNLSVELRYILGHLDDTNNISGDNVTVEVKKSNAVFFKYAVDSGGLYPYLIMGQTNTSLNAYMSSGDSNLTVSDFSYGAGLEFGKNNSSSFNVEYLRLLDTGDITINAFSAGFKLVL